MVLTSAPRQKSRLLDRNASSSSSFVFTSSRYAGYQEHSSTTSRRPVLSECHRRQHSTGAASLQTPPPAHAGVIPGFIPLGQPSRPSSPLAAKTSLAYLPPELLSPAPMSTPPIEAAEWTPEWKPAPTVEQEHVSDSDMSSPQSSVSSLLASSHPPASASSASSVSSPARRPRLDAVNPASLNLAVGAEPPPIQPLVSPVADVKETRGQKKERNISVAEVFSSMGPSKGMLDTHTQIKDFGGMSSTSATLLYPSIKKRGADESVLKMKSMKHLPSDDPTKKHVDNPVLDALDDALSQITATKSLPDDNSLKRLVDDPVIQEQVAVDASL